MLVDTLDLDARHPTLDDHRPGGLPLFGTCMSIDALGSAARRLGAAPADFVYRDVEINRPCILADGGTWRLTIRLAPAGEAAAGTLIGEVLSLDEATSSTLHLRARLRPGKPPPVRTIRLPFLPDPAVESVDIYTVFFHGPTFRVVDRARYQAGEMVTRMAQHAELRHIPPAARLLEFALQSAGLLELATNDRMMIPHSIGQIAPGIVAEATLREPIHAVPRYGADGGIDIAVLDSGGHNLMTVAAYHTLPLPFASDIEAAQGLAARLRGVPADA